MVSYRLLNAVKVHGQKPGIPECVNISMVCVHHCILIHLMSAFLIPRFTRLVPQHYQIPVCLLGWRQRIIWQN